MDKLKNFLNVRVQGVNHTKLLSRAKHNLRHVAAITNEGTADTNILIDIHSNKQYEYMSRKNSASYTFYKHIAKEYQADRKSHNDIIKKRQHRNLQDKNGTWAEGVLTFSEAIKTDKGVKYSEQELIDCAKDMLKEFEEFFGTEVKSLYFHKDESTDHFHFFFKNFDDLGKSITHKNRDKETLSKLQDLMFKHFSKLEMKRGIKKEVSGYDYSKVKSHLKSDIAILEKKQNKLISNINELKALRKKTSIEVVKFKNEKKEIYKDISDKQKSLRSEYKVLQAKKQELIKQSKEVSKQEVSLENAVDSYKNTVKSMPKDTRDVISTIQNLNTKLEDYESFMKTNQDINFKFKKHEQKEKIKKLEKEEKRVNLKARIKENQANRSKVSNSQNNISDIEF